MVPIRACIFTLKTLQLLHNFGCPHNHDQCRVSNFFAARAKSCRDWMSSVAVDERPIFNVLLRILLEFSLLLHQALFVRQGRLLDLLGQKRQQRAARGGFLEGERLLRTRACS